MDVSIAEILTHARVFNLGSTVIEADLRSALHALFDELEAGRVDYLLVGGVALLSYVAGRNTQDIDLIVDPADVTRVSWSAELRDRDFGSAVYRSINVDFLLTTNALFNEVRAKERATLTFEGRPIPSVTREGLVLLKLYALPSLYRQGKLDRAALYETDILMLHQGVSIDDEALLSRLGRHLAAHDVDELRKILGEQRARRRFDE
jgi:hypothetical protein